MGKDTEQKSTVSLSARLLLYSTTVASIVLFAVTFYILSDHHSKLHQLQSLVEEFRATDDKHDFYGSNIREILQRSAREASRPGETSAVDQYLEGIIDWQLKSLRAHCLANERICIQGPKGVSGVRGNNGKMGPPGSKGDQGKSGIKGEKGDRGPPGTTVAQPPVIITSPNDVVTLESSTATFDCQASANPKPSLSWCRLDETPLPRARSTVSSNNTLTISSLRTHDAGSYVCEAENVFGVTRAYATLVVQVPVDFVKVSPEIVNVSLGQNVTLDCVAKGYPTPTITWSAAGELPESSRLESNGSLIIENVTGSDLGQYVCTARSDLGTKSHSVTLKLGLDDSFSNSVVVHTTAFLKCRLCSFSDLSTVRWEKDGGNIAEERAEQKDCTLVIRNTSLGDTGNYTCVATSKSGGHLRQKLPLIVKGGARITSSFASVVTVPFGGRVELECDGVGPPTPDLYWTKGSVRIRNSPQGRLKIANATLQDNGVYSCHAVNYLGRQEKETRIVVIRLEFVIRPPATVTASLSQTIVIDCTARAAPGLPASTHWSFPQCGKPSIRRGVLSNGTLVIPQATADDSGLYQCNARFGEEKLVANVTLSVPQVDTSWMLTSDSCGGFRQSTYDNSVYYAVSSSNRWDKSKYYHCPRGYHWACTEEGRKIFKNNSNWSGTYVYHGQCGWSGHTFAGVYRYLFRFRDSATTNAYKHGGNYDECRVQFNGDTSNFAGVVCIKD